MFNTRVQVRPSFHFWALMHYFFFLPASIARQSFLAFHRGFEWKQWITKSTSYRPHSNWLEHWRTWEMLASHFLCLILPLGVIRQRETSGLLLVCSLHRSHVVQYDYGAVSNKKNCLRKKVSIQFTCMESPLSRQVMLEEVLKGRGKHRFSWNLDMWSIVSFEWRIGDI